MRGGPRPKHFQSVTAHVTKSEIMNHQKFCGPFRLLLAEDPGNMTQVNGSNRRTGKRDAKPREIAWPKRECHTTTEIMASLSLLVLSLIAREQSHSFGLSITGANVSSVCV